MAPSAYACNDIAATRSALASSRRSRSRRASAAVKLRRARATSAADSRRVKSRFACARSRAARACPISPPFRLKSGSASASPTVGSTPWAGSAGSPRSTPSWRLGAGITLRWASARLRSSERRAAAAAATRSASPAGAGALSGGVTSASARVMLAVSAGRPIASCTASSSSSAASESSTATFSSWPAFTSASRTSSSLTSPTSRRSRAIVSRLSASRALRRDSRACAAVARARV